MNKRVEDINFDPTYLEEGEGFITNAWDPTSTGRMREETAQSIAAELVESGEYETVRVIPAATDIRNLASVVARPKII